jgi:hypothetical protein
MDDGQKKLDKLNVATALLNSGSLFLHLDPRVTDVIVPAWLQHQPQLVLQVGWDMPIPIPDLKVDSEGVYGTLSFSRTPYICHMPWKAIFALVGDEGQGMIWEDSMPPEIAAEIERETQKAKREKSRPTTILRTVKPLKPATIKPTQPNRDKNGKLKLPSYLRVIK